MPAPTSKDAQIQAAMDLLPETGEVEFDAYKAQLYAQNTDRGKEVFTQLLKAKLVTQRLQFVDGKPTVFLSRKAG